MDTVKANKQGWEEAYEHRLPGYGENMAENLKDGRLVYFDTDAAAALEVLGYRGKRVAQLCCNNGRELLNLVAAGAESGVGFDIAENMVAFAGGVAAQTGLPCQFVAGDVLDIPGAYDGTFDLVLATEGALCWFRDPGAFFGVAARLLRPGGAIFLREIHPVTGMFAYPGEEEYDAAQGRGGLAYSYFRTEPWHQNGMGYMSGDYECAATLTSWSHTLGRIITALAQNGFCVKSLAEQDYDIGLGDTYNGLGIPQAYTLTAQKSV